MAKSPEPLADSIVVDNDVVLQRVQPADAQELYEIVSAEKDHLGSWLDFAHRFTPLIAANHCSEASDQAERGTGADYWIVTPDGRQGYIDLRQTYGNQWDIRYWLRAEATGQRLASRSVTAVSEYAFVKRGATEVELKINNNNKASQRVAERCGAMLLPVATEGDYGIWSITR